MFDFLIAGYFVCRYELPVEEMLELERERCFYFPTEICRYHHVS